MQTINHFFNLHTGSQEWVSRVIKSEEFNQIEKKLVQEIEGFQVPPAFYELLIREVTQALDIEMSDLLVWAWRTRREIAQYRDRERYPPGESHIVPLIEHTVVSKHSPTIQPVVNNVPLQKIKFDVILKLKMKGAMLKIRDAKIMEILVGSCSGSGAIEYAGLAILEKKTAPYEFPGTISLGEGVSI